MIALYGLTAVPVARRVGVTRANGALAPVTRTSALAAEDGDTMVLFGPAADS